MNKVDALYQVNEGLDILIEQYPKDSPVARELKQTQDNILGLLLGDKAGTLNQALSKDLSTAMKSISSERIKHALLRLDQDEKVAQRLLEKEQLRELLAD